MNEFPQAVEPTAAQREELRGLLERCSVGKLTRQDAERLDRTLGAYAWARIAYLDTMAIEAELHASHAITRQASSGGAITSLDVSTHDSLLDPVDQEIGPYEGKRRKYVSWASIAASLLGVAIASSWMTAKIVESSGANNVAQGPNTVANGRDDSVVSSAATVAEITATRNCRWKGATVGCGDEVKLGQRLDLLQGVAELLFPSGVTVLLEGPATLDFNRDGSLAMLSGRLCVDSPEDADSLRIKAGRMVLAQSGASCGVLADNIGGGEVHVFRGEVHAVVLDRGGQQLQRCSFSGGAGGRLMPAARLLTPIAAHGDLFVRSLTPSTGLQDGLIAVESFDYPEGPLSEQNGGYGWAGPWTEIESMPGPTGASTNNICNRSLNRQGVPPVGNHFRQTGQANRVRRVLGTSFRGVFDTAGLVENRDAHRLIGRDGKSIYIAVLQRVNQLDDVFYGLELNRGDGNGNRVLCVGNGAEGARYAVTSNYNNDDKVALLGEETTETNLVVIRIDYGPNDYDRAIVYRNPRSLVDEFKCRPAAEIKGNFSFDRVSFGNFEGTKVHEVDELRIGTSFRVVTGQRSFLQAPIASDSSQRLNWLVAAPWGSHAPQSLATLGSRLGYSELFLTRRN